jgi:pimeloyl-ACP methyl ester carboxylesterase
VVEEALRDQMDVLAAFRQRYGSPRRTIAWGGSMGGLVSAALVERHPESFDGGMSVCGVMGGAVASWNLRLDSAFAFRTLLAPTSTLQLVHVRDGGAELATARRLAAEAEKTAAGRARLSLAAALGDLPDWPGPVNDFYVASRAELERRAGGNPSWNTGVDYRGQLERSRYRAEVAARYQAAGLDPDADLDRLGRAARIAADTGAVAYLSRNATLTGVLRGPFLTVHGTVDGLVPVEHEQAYTAQVSAAGRSEMLRTLFIDRAGHCAISPAEQLVALQVLLERLRGRTWTGLEPAELNRRGRGLPGAAPAFTGFQPGPFLRPFPLP